MQDFAYSLNHIKKEYDCTPSPEVVNSGILKLICREMSLGPFIFVEKSLKSTSSQGDSLSTDRPYLLTFRTAPWKCL